MGKFKQLEYFDAALQRTLEATVMKTFTESLNAMDLSIHTEHPIKDWKSVLHGTSKGVKTRDFENTIN